ncbi:MAG: anti-ECFsigma factor, ChrR [Verrucomicrobiales bacterium]|nr:anti-ECFsigma factor, ChrR [Verrucomicrobiales bacterium]
MLLNTLFTRTSSPARARGVKSLFYPPRPRPPCLHRAWKLSHFTIISRTVLPPSQPDPAPPYSRLELPNLLNIVQWQDQLPWQPFRDGVEIHRLYGDGIQGPTAALIRFQKAGRIPLHTHHGYEHIMVLHGSQRDQNSVAQAGTLMINAPGTSHSVMGEAGCIVLAIYEKPVAFGTETKPPREQK